MKRYCRYRWRVSLSSWVYESVCVRIVVTGLLMRDAMVKRHAREHFLSYLTRLERKYNHLLFRMNIYNMY